MTRIRTPEHLRELIRSNQQRQIELREKERELKAELAESEGRERELRRLRDKGLTYTEIAFEVGLTQQRVYQLLHPRRQEGGKV